MEEVKFPKYILVKACGDGFISGDVEQLSEGGESTPVARYKLVGTGVVHSYVDYVEDESAAA